MSETISHKLREDIFTQNTGERIVFIILKIASTKFIACNKEVMNQWELMREKTDTTTSHNNFLFYSKTKNLKTITGNSNS